MSVRPVGSRPDQRDCALYRFYVRHPVTGRRVLGYIGETARMPFQRLMEHIYQQPWADTILGWEVEDVVYRGKDAVLAAERAAIHAERPLYNIEENLGNRERIPPWDAVAQRQAREPGWVPPAKGERVPRQRVTSSYPTRVPTPTRYGAWAWFRRHPAAQVAVVLLVVFGGLVWASAGRLDGWDPAGAGLAGVAGVFALALVEGRTWARLWRGLTGPKRRRRRR